MRRIYSIISILTVSCFFTVSAGAQRPVWIIGHGANWGKKNVQTVLELGGNGVEIDVRTQSIAYSKAGEAFGLENTEGKHWALGHDTYTFERNCDANKNWSLKQFLAMDILNDSRFCLLWLDCKDEEYIRELVEYVHAQTPNGTPYAIIYNVYKTGQSRATLEWLAKNLRNNEGMNWGDVSIKDLKPHVEGVIPPSKHFFSRGLFKTHWIKNSSDRASDIRVALSYAKSGQFCCRAGIWTGDTAYETYYWLYNGKKTASNYDVIISYFQGGYTPPLCKKNAMSKCMNDKFKVNGQFRANKASNDGQVRIATRSDVFFR